MGLGARRREKMLCGGLQGGSALLSATLEAEARVITDTGLVCLEIERK